MVFVCQTHEEHILADAKVFLVTFWNLYGCDSHQVQVLSFDKAICRTARLNMFTKYYLSPLGKKIQLIR